MKLATAAIAAIAARAAVMFIEITIWLASRSLLGSRLNAATDLLT